MGLIYKITNVIDGTIYVGQTKDTFNKRWIHHKSDAKCGNKNTHFCNALKKYGLESFEREIIEECSNEFLDEREIYWIAFFDSYFNGYNLTPGGGQGTEVAEQTRQKISESLKGRKRSPETIKRMSESLKGKVSPMHGKKHSSETIEKIKEKRKLQIMSEETKKKISESNKGKKHTEEAKEKMRNHVYDRKGRIPWNKGKSISEEEKKIRKAELQRRYREKIKRNKENEKLF
jgi:group I intron endonuclease